MSQQSQKIEIRKRQTWLLFQFYKNKMKQTSCSHCLKKSHPPAVLGRPCWSSINCDHAHPLCCPQQCVTALPLPQPSRLFPFQLKEGLEQSLALLHLPVLQHRAAVTLCQAWAGISHPSKSLFPSQAVKFACPWVVWSGWAWFPGSVSAGMFDVLSQGGLCLCWDCSLSDSHGRDSG